MRADEPPIIVSACLAGLATTHNGTAKPSPAVMDLVAQGRAILVCPEQLGGLTTPRLPAEVVGDPGGASCAGGPDFAAGPDGPAGPDGAGVLAGTARVVDAQGNDVTAQYVRGAREALKLARLSGATKAILKARSPSCGSARIHDGTFSGTLKDGSGVTAALLRQEGIEVLSEEDL